MYRWKSLPWDEELARVKGSFGGFVQEKKLCSATVQGRCRVFPIPLFVQYKITGNTMFGTACFK